MRQALFSSIAAAALMFGSAAYAQSVPACAPGGGAQKASGESERIGAQNASGESERIGAQNASGESERIGAQNASGESERIGAQNASGKPAKAAGAGGCG